MSESVIQAANLHRSYRIGKKSIEVLHGIDLDIARGERVFLCGPSGAGKTTLLYTLAGLERPEQGSVHIDGTDLYSLGPKKQAAFRNAKIGYIFQNYLLLPELTALENVLVPGAIGGKDESVAALAALKRVGLADRAEHLPAELSGGEQQRVAIARAVAPGPQIIFADEPTGNLDGHTGAAIIDLLFTRQQASGATLIIITHDPDLAQRCDRIVEMRDGLIVEGAPA